MTDSEREQAAELWMRKNKGKLPGPLTESDWEQIKQVLVAHGAECERRAIEQINMSEAAAKLLAEGERRGMERAAKAMCAECRKGELMLLTNSDGQTWHGRFPGDDLHIPCGAAAIRQGSQDHE